jgi:lipoprotein-anchoring transpeptidase ErfK/SrfK
MAMRGRPAVALAAGLVAAGALVTAAPASSGPAAPPGVDATTAAAAPRAVASRPTTREAWTARVLLPVATRAKPSRRAKRTGKLSVHAPYNGGPQVLLVLEASATAKDGVWYKVLLPRRPNDAAGWVPAEAVQVKRTPYRVMVHVGTRKAELLKAGRVVDRWTVAVGTSANPTPQGRFAISEVVRQKNPSGFFGPYILTLTAHSEHLSDFDGGDGRVALHGTSLPSLLGQAVSHGCVRFANDAATRLGKTVPPGAPVDIVS